MISLSRRLSSVAIAEFRARARVSAVKCVDARIERSAADESREASSIALWNFPFLNFLGKNNDSRTSRSSADPTNLSSGRPPSAKRVHAKIQASSREGLWMCCRGSQNSRERFPALEKRIKILYPSMPRREIVWKWRRREENDRVDYGAKFPTEFGDRDEDVGERPARTTTDLELDSDRAWNSILDSAGHVEWTKFEFVSSFRIRASGAANVPRLPHSAESGIRNVSASILRITADVPPDSIHYKFFGRRGVDFLPARNPAAPIRFKKFMIRRSEITGKLSSGEENNSDDKIL